MLLRVHVEFISTDRVRVTKFSGQREVSLKDLINRNFDLHTFKFISKASDYFLSFYNGEGTVEDPYQVTAYRINVDTGSYENLGIINYKGPRDMTVEARIRD